MAVPISCRRPKASLISTRACSWSNREQHFLSNINESTCKDLFLHVVEIRIRLLRQVFRIKIGSEKLVSFPHSTKQIPTSSSSCLRRWRTSRRNPSSYEHTFPKLYLLSDESFDHVRSAFQVTLGPTQWASFQSTHILEAAGFWPRLFSWLCILAMLLEMISSWACTFPN